MSVSGTLQRLEELLLTAEVRRNAQELGSLLGDDFREIGSSGRVFSKAEIIPLLQAEDSAVYSLDNFEVLPIAEGAFLATYRAVKAVAGSAASESLRSSIWVLRDGRWQMIFHQGTRAGE